MRVRVQYTVDASDEYRRAIRHFYGKTGMATREEVVDWLKDYGSSEDDNIMWSLGLAEADEGN